MYPTPHTLRNFNIYLLIAGATITPHLRRCGHSWPTLTTMWIQQVINIYCTFMSNSKRKPKLILRKKLCLQLKQNATFNPIQVNIFAFIDSIHIFFILDFVNAQTFLSKSSFKQDHQRWRYITVDFGNINGYEWPHGMIWTNGFKRTTKHNCFSQSYWEGHQELYFL